MLESLECRQLLAASAVDDFLVTDFQTPITFQPGQLIANDLDVLRILSKTSPANGSLVSNPDGSLTYIPNSGFTGTDTFNYTGQSAVNTGPGHVLDFGGNGLLRLHSFSWGISNRMPNYDPATEQEPGPAPSDFSFSAALSRATAGIVAALLDGTPGSHLDLISRDSQGREYLRYRLNSPQFTAYSQADAEGRPIDTFAVTFDALSVVQTSSADSKSAITADAGFNFTANLPHPDSGPGQFPMAKLDSGTLNSGLYLSAISDTPTHDGTANVNGALPIHSYSFGVSRGAITPGGSDGGGAGSGAPQFQAMTVSFDSGPASAAFLDALLRNRWWGEFAVTSGSDGMLQSRQVFTKVRVLDYQTSAGDRPLDSITFTYEGLESTSYESNDSKAAARSVSWNVKESTGTPFSSIDFGGKSAGTLTPLSLNLGTGQLPVMAFSAGTSRGIDNPGGSVKDRDTSAPSISSFDFTLPVGLHAPKLLLATASGGIIPSAVLTARSPGGDALTTWTLENVSVSAYFFSGSGPEATLSVSFNVTGFTQTVTPDEKQSYQVSYDLISAKAGDDPGFGSTRTLGAGGYFLLVDQNNDLIADVQVPVNSFSWGVSQPQTTGGPAAPSDAAEISDISVIGGLSAASAGLLYNALAGEAVTMGLVHNDANGQEMQRWLLNDVMVSSFSQGIGSDGIPHESFGLNFTGYEYRHTERDSKGGSLGSVTTNWDLATARPITSPALGGGTPTFPISSLTDAQRRAGMYLQATGPSSPAISKGITPLAGFFLGDSIAISQPDSKGDRQTGPAGLHPIQISVPRSSATLAFLAAAQNNGETWDQVIITTPTEDGDFIEYSLTEVIVTSISMSDFSGASLIDTVLLSAAAVQMTVVPASSPAVTIISGYNAKTLEVTPTPDNHFGKQQLNAELPEHLLELPGGDIALHSVQWSANAGDSISGNTGGAAVGIGELVVSARPGAHSPGLFAAVAGGLDLAEVTLTSFDAQGRQFLVWNFERVIITSYSFGGSGDHLHETFTLSPVKFSLAVYSVDDKAVPLTVSYDLKDGQIESPGTFGNATLPGVFTTDTATVSITVNPPAPPPLPDLDLDTPSIAENAPAGTRVATVQAIGGGENPTLLLVNDGGGRFALNGNELVVADASLLDFESQSSHTIRIRLGEGNLAYEEEFTISLTNINEAPVLQPLADWAINEGQSILFTASAPDPDTDSTLVYSLATATPGASIDAATGTFSFTPANDGVYAVTIVASDGELSHSQSFTVNVSNVVPVPASITSNAGGIGGASEGSAVQLTIPFSDPGLADQHSVRIDWGDGQTSGAKIAGTGGQFIASANHAYASAGIYTVTITLRDDDTTQVLTQVVYVSGAAVHGGVLQVIGTAGKDTIHLAPGKQRTLEISGIGALPARRIRQDSFETILLLSGGGNDSILVSPSIRNPLWVSAGPGNDTVQAGSGPSILLGGPGNDQLIGGRESDLLIGGPGADLLRGLSDQDILIAGSTTHDSDFSALQSVLDEWRSNRPRSTRMANITGAGSGPRLNGTVFLNAQTLIDDAESDVLGRSNPDDWLLLGRRDITIKGHRDKAKRG